MKPGTPCFHCTESGCAIYERRPVIPCRKFICAWAREGSRLPERLKPGECGAIIILDRSWNGRKVTYAFPAGTKIPPETLEWLIADAQKTSVPLIFTENLAENGSITGQKVRGYGPPWFIKAVKMEIKPEDIIRL